MDYQRFVSICYPKYRKAARIIEQLSLKQRSLLIKACQGQIIPVDPTSTLYKLLSEDVTFSLPFATASPFVTVPLRELFYYFGASPDEPCQSAILLDLLRCCPASDEDYVSFKLQGWVKEIVLSESPVYDEPYNFAYFFDLTFPGTFHSLTPDNQAARAIINRRFEVLKKGFQTYKPTIYSRHTHKNMSFSTRREYERATDISLDGVPIFGQDDWIRHYHQTGEKLGGSVEMRQKWYPSGAKPRTYFAQGGTAYTYSRFLQDFFTTLVNAFPSTNHITRLQPFRLKFDMATEDGGHYLVYDLTSFTSNMVAQRAFCRELAGFFMGVEVDIFDEYYGVLTMDLGEMLMEYYEHCVGAPNPQPGESSNIC